uniref:MHD domain-containing protein n=1 Tax=Hemiselmis andersenii TaxID=464988 RepID=A0A6T8L757_HEMAN|mmetsp:Transcript_42173/g.98246  ORF Transcript_42173/g.98246 Transcript_42173/m.98246 type:complete len:424 (+) Transcript_42173:84-1355(+)
MTASAVFILDMKGKVIISRNYRGDVPMSCVERFVHLMIDEAEGSNPPVIVDNGVSYVYVKYGNLYLMACTKRNSNAATLFVFLYHIVGVLKDYFRELEEESIRDNFVVTYELLDEMMDWGYPQITDQKILSEYIMQESHKMAGFAKPPPAVTGVVSWRSEGIKYRKNEIFLDVVESVNILVSSTGSVLRSEILGALKMRSYLSGMPELKLGLNDKLLFESSGRGSKQGKSVEMEDIKFHQCVRLARFENDRTISFIPPDGEFELMSYRLSTQVRPLIWIEAVVEPHTGSRIEYMIKAKSQFKSRSVANNVEILIPVPPDADSPSFKCSVGSAKYAPERDCVVWTIKQFAGQKEFVLRAHFGLPSVQADGALPKKPISVKFEIPYYTVSGIQVRYLKIMEKSGYQALPWVRYITQNGDYQLRMS